MRIAQAAFNALFVNPFRFRADCAWGLPLIVLTVVIHVIGLGLVSQRAVQVSSGLIGAKHTDVLRFANFRRPHSIRNLVWKFFPF